jgi:hypothetical protein
VRAVRRADHDEARDAIGITLAERERDHAAIRGPGDRADGRESQVVDETQQQLRLVVRRDRRERTTVARPGRVRARAEIVEAQDAESLGVERKPGTHHLVPPSAPRFIGQPHASRCGNPTQRDDDGRARGAGESPRNRNGLEDAAEVQLHRARNGQHAFAHERMRRAFRTGRLAG